MAKRFLNVFEHNFDAIILGAGGSGLRCAYGYYAKWIKDRGCYSYFLVTLFQHRRY